MPRLVVNPKSPAAWEIQLKAGTNSIGRGSANDFKIEDPSVSGSHCQILVDSGRSVLRDLGSTNGSFINRAPVTEVELQPGQTIHLGGVELQFLPDAAAIATASGTFTLKRPPDPVPSSAPPASPIRIVPTPLPSTPEPAAPRAPAPVARLNVRTTPRAESSATAAAAPPPVLEESAPAEPETPHHCKFHPRTLARFACPNCHHGFCELCVASRPTGGVQKKFCRHCGAECQPLQVSAAAYRPVERGFFLRLPTAFVYPFKGAGVLVLIFGTVLFAALNMLGGSATGSSSLIPRAFSFTLIFKVFAIGYLFAFMQSIIHAAAIGDEEMPSLPSMASFWEDILLPSLQFLGLVAISFGPAIAVILFTLTSDESSYGPLLIASIVLGALYFPMAFLAVAMLDSVLAANPIQVVPSILKVPIEYLVTIILLAVVIGMRPLGDFLIPAIFPRGLATHNMAKLFGYLAASAFWSFFRLYLLTVGMRILGLLYFTKKDKLGWLDR